MAERAGRGPGRRAWWWQGALAALALGGLLGAFLGIHRGPTRCTSIPPQRVGECLLTGIPAPDFIVGEPTLPLATYSSPEPRPPREAGRDHRTVLPWWWVHAFYRLALPLQGWGLEALRDSDQWHLATYCRTDSCVQVEVVEGADAVAYRVTVWPKAGQS